MKIACRRGHQRTGADGCAADLVNEIDIANEYMRWAIYGFKKVGEEVLDVTPPEAHRSLSDSLMYGVNAANKWGADIFLSFHVNATGRTTATVGCETVYNGNSTKGKIYASNIDGALARLGFKDRGAKADVRGLCEIKRVNAPTVIIEPFFVSSVGDVSLYNKIGPKAIGFAIVEAITGKHVEGYEVGWNEDSNGYFYSTDGSNYYKDGFYLIDNDWYYFDERGYIKSGWVKYKNDWYYLNTEHDGTFGKMKTGWISISNSWYYLNTEHDGTFGKMMTGWITYAGKKCYLEEREGMNQGHCYINGKYVINDKSYEFDSAGYLVE